MNPDAARLPGLPVADGVGLNLACVVLGPAPLAAAGKPVNATTLERARQHVQKRRLPPLRRERGICRSRLHRIFGPMGGAVRCVGRRLQ